MFHEGQTIGLYTLIRRIGRGGFGEVWLAERRTALLTTRVAVKLPLDSQIDLETVRQEAILWEQASGHPNVLPIIEANIYDGQVVIISEYAPDGSLADRLKAEGVFSAQKAVEFAIGVAAGLEFLHSRRIIHRDIKPQNILLQGDTPRLADFGISHALQTSVASRSTNIKGTFSYMAPEAFDGVRNAQTDIWAIGVILYQMLTGSLPFPQQDPTALFGAIIAREPGPLPDTVPLRIKEIIAKTLTKLPENRYQMAREMREDLQRALVGINYPTVAPTEFLRHSPSAPIIQPPIPSPPTQNTELHIETNAASIYTHVQSTPPTKENEKYTRPAVETPLFSAPVSIVTQVGQPITNEISKPLPTVAQVFADKTHASPKSNKRYFILPVIAFFALTVIGGGYFLLKNKAVFVRQMMLPPIEASKLIPYRKGEDFGYSDAQKRIYIEPQFYDAKPFSEDLALVQVRGSKYGYIDKTGNFVIQPNFDIGDYSMESFSEGLAKVCHSKKCGYINKSGNWAIQPKYFSADSFVDGLAKVCLEPSYNEIPAINSCGFIDKSGNEVIPLKYYNVYSFSEGLASVVDKTVADKNVYDKATYYDGNTVFIDKTGKIVIKTDRRSGLPFSTGWAGLPDIKSTKYIDKSGNVVLETKFTGSSFSEGLAPVQGSGNSSTISIKWGFIDKTGKLVIPVQYDTADSFSEGLALIALDKKSGYIDKTGRIIIPLKYRPPIVEGGDGVWNFKNGIARVVLDMKHFYIGKDGTEYYDP